MRTAHRIAVGRAWGRAGFNERVTPARSAADRRVFQMRARWHVLSPMHPLPAGRTVGRTTRHRSSSAPGKNGSPPALGELLAKQAKGKHEHRRGVSV